MSSGASVERSAFGHAEITMEANECPTLPAPFKELTDAVFRNGTIERNGDRMRLRWRERFRGKRVRRRAVVIPRKAQAEVAKFVEWALEQRAQSRKKRAKERIYQELYRARVRELRRCLRENIRGGRCYRESVLREFRKAANAGIHELEFFMDLALVYLEQKPVEVQRDGGRPFAFRSRLPSFW